MVSPILSFLHILLCFSPLFQSISQSSLIQVNTLFELILKVTRWGGRCCFERIGMCRNGPHCEKSSPQALHWSPRWGPLCLISLCSRHPWELWEFSYLIFLCVPPLFVFFRNNDILFFLGNGLCFSCLCPKSQIKKNNPAPLPEKQPYTPDHVPRPPHPPDTRFLYSPTHSIHGFPSDTCFSPI